MWVVILDDAGRFLRMADVDEIGTIAISGSNVFAGYLDSLQNKDLWIDIKGARWLNTGDLGRQDDRGYFWLAGRRKELIIRSGHNIDPKLIEDALSKHPAVALAAAVGSPDAYAGEVPVVYIQPKPGLSVSDQELMDFAAAHVPERAAIPKQVKVMSSLPVTGIGKIFKPALRQREIEAVVRAEAAKVGASIGQLWFERDSRVGQVVRVRTSTGAAPLKAALERYPFKSDVLNNVATQFAN